MTNGLQEVTWEARKVLWAKWGLQVSRVDAKLEDEGLPEGFRGQPDQEQEEGLGSGSHLKP